MPERISYAGSVHGEAEIHAVVDALRDPRGLWPGRRVNEMERQVAALFGKAKGLMCNSGSSALYLAVELLDLPEGSEVITSALTFSTDISPLVRGRLVPVFADVEADTYNVDIAGLEPLVGRSTRAILLPNLIGNAPDWDAVRAIADRHGLAVIEDSCDALGATLRGAPTGTRSDISVTSFANSHIITCAGTGGMVLLDDDQLRDRGLLLRRWGRRSELHFFGTKKRDRNFWEDLDGIRYDNQFIFDELAWNFEPSELGAAFGLEQLKRLPANHERRQRNFAMYTDFVDQHPERFVSPRQLDGLETAWLCYPITIRPGAGFERAQLQQFLEERGIDTRTIWTGNATRQPMMKEVAYRVGPGGLPNADRVMEGGMILPCSHALTDADVEYVIDQLQAFLSQVG